MSHEVGKEGDVVETVKEVLGETVTEGVWINHITVKTILFGKVLQLDGYATSGKAIARTIGEQIARGDVLFC